MTLEEIAHQNQLQALRAMTPAQRAMASLKEQDLQRRSALLGQRGPIHFSGLQGQIQAQPRNGILAQLARLFDARAAP